MELENPGSFLYVFLKLKIGPFRFFLKKSVKEAKHERLLSQISLIKKVLKTNTFIDLLSYVALIFNAHFR